MPTSELPSITGVRTFISTAIRRIPQSLNCGAGWSPALKWQESFPFLLSKLFRFLMKEPCFPAISVRQAKRANGHPRSSSIRDSTGQFRSYILDTERTQLEEVTTA